MAEYHPVDGKYYYYTTDQINSTRVVTDDLGNVVYAAAHDPYGGVQQTWVNSFNPVPKFSGKERDEESGLDYFGARYYDHTLYRFLSPDPVIPTDRAIYNPQRWNLYGYCNNNPINYVDPNGDIIIKVYRTDYASQGTYGIYKVQLGDMILIGYTYEPAIGQGKGPIPVGEYSAYFRPSPNKGYAVIELKGVPGFKRVQIHIGNFKEDTIGCILTGRNVVDGKLTKSKEAFDELMNKLLEYIVSTTEATIYGGYYDIDWALYLFDLRVAIIDIPPPEGIAFARETSANWILD